MILLALAGGGSHPTQLSSMAPAPGPPQIQGSRSGQHCRRRVSARRMNKPAEFWLDGVLFDDDCSA